MTGMGYLVLIRATITYVSGSWWAHVGSNHGPLPCQGSALPLSYAPVKEPRRIQERRLAGWLEPQPASHAPGTPKA